MRVVVRHVGAEGGNGKVTVQIQNEGGEAIDPAEGAPIPVEGIELRVGEEATLVVTDEVGREPDLDEIRVGGAA